MKSVYFPHLELPEPRAKAQPAVRPRRQRVARSGHALVPCIGCKGDVQLKVPNSAPAPNPTLISAAQALPAQVKAMTWAYGVTTVPERRTNGLLLRSLASLRAAGFDSPRLFVDGPEPPPILPSVYLECPTTFRSPKVRTVANWALGMLELLARNPQADRFVMFQDDIACSSNLRQYLERCVWPERGYCNLFTFRENELAVRGKPVGWHRAWPLNGKGGDPAYQKGLGGLALAFSRDALEALFAGPHLYKKMMDVREDHQGRAAGAGPKPWPDDGSPRRLGQVRIDGAVVTAMNLAGWSEHVHQPSLVDHLGNGGLSAMGNGGSHHAATFRGEEFDCLSLLKT